MTTQSKLIGTLGAQAIFEMGSVFALVTGSSSIWLLLFLWGVSIVITVYYLAKILNESGGRT